MKTMERNELGQELRNEEVGQAVFTKRDALELLVERLEWLPDLGVDQFTVTENGQKHGTRKYSVEGLHAEIEDFVEGALIVFSDYDDILARKDDMRELSAFMETSLEDVKYDVNEELELYTIVISLIGGNTITIEGTPEKC